LLADEICTTKAMITDETILSADLAPRPGLIDLVMDAFAGRRLGGRVTTGPEAGPSL